MKTIILSFLALILIMPVSLMGQSTEPLVYHDTNIKEGIGVGKHIVFLAGDHEYRSEETLPALAKILARRHGFKCTVLFNVNPDTGEIEPGNSNMPGMESLKTADLAVVFLRFQNFPAEQMQHFVDYLDRGGPIVGLRTSTHAFQIPAGSEFERFDHKYPGKEFEKGFGRQILGETWVSHYGKNHVMSTRLDVVESAADHPILRGVERPWAQCGGYWVEPAEDSNILAMAQPLEAMTADAAPAEGKKPCPGAWTREYTSNSGNVGRVFTSTYGASEDILDDDYRRMLLNACVWSCGLEEHIVADANIEFVGSYTPVTYGFNTHRLKVKPQDYADWDSNISPIDNPLGQGRPKRKKRQTQRKPDEKANSAATEASLETQAPIFTPQPLAPLALKKGDHVCLVGNELGERMQHHNWFEASLHAAFPEHNLSVRNLCFPGDESQKRIRSKSFGSPDMHLTHSKASVVLFFFWFQRIIRR